MNAACEANEEIIWPHDSNGHITIKRFLSLRFHWGELLKEETLSWELDV